MLLILKMDATGEAPPVVGADLTHQTGSDIWSVGIDTTDPDGSRPYKVARGNDISTNERFEIAPSGQLTCSFYATPGNVLTVNAGGVITETAGGGAGVQGPVSATDNAVCRFDNSGTVIQNSGILIDDSDNMTGVGTINGITIENSANPKLIGTGVLSGGILSVNGGDDTKFDISDGSGYIQDPVGGTLQNITWTGLTSQTHAYSGILTYIYISANNTWVATATKPSNTEIRDKIFLGVLVHTNGVNLNTVNNEQMTLVNTQNQIRDLSEALGFLNVSGNLLNHNGSGLSISKSAGSLYKFGSNYQNDIKNPHIISLSAIDTSAGGTFQYRMRDGTSSALTLTDLIANIKDDGTAYPGTTYSTNNRYGVHRVFSFVSNALKIQPTQDDYKTMSEAISSINDGSFIVEPSIAENGILVGYIITVGTVTDLSVSTDAMFLSAGKFGNSISNTTGGTQDLQSVYDNVITQPEILTDATRGALSVQRGSAADTDNVLEVKNGATQVKFSVTGAGKVSCTEAFIDEMNVRGKNFATASCFIGRAVGDNLTTGTSNTVVGDSAGYSIDQGSGNTLVGLSAGEGLTTGSDNTFVGKNAGEFTNATGNRNVAIGADMSFNSPAEDSIIIGNNSTVAVSRQCKVGSSTVGQSLTTFVPATDNECDLGSSSLQWKDGYFGGSVILTHKTVGPTSTGTLGELAVDTAYIYRCIATDTWERVATSTWTFDPSTISGLQGHYDASNASSMSQSAGDVTVWTDLTANNNDLSSVNGTPRTGDSTQNSLNIVDFIANENIYNTGALVNYDNHTIVMVVKITSTASGVLHDIFGSGSRITTVDGHVSMGKWLASGNQVVNFKHVRDTSPNNDVTTPSWTLDTGWHILVQHTDNSSINVMLDGAIHTYVPTGTLSGLSRGICLFTLDGTQRATTGSIGEVLVYDTFLSNQDLNNLGKHLATKWALSWTDV
jgi:hypothetical protein